VRATLRKWLWRLIYAVILTFNVITLPQALDLWEGVSHVCKGAGRGAKKAWDELDTMEARSGR
jgi:hypothetical protein